MKTLLILFQIVLNVRIRYIGGAKSSITPNKELNANNTIIEMD